MYFRLPAWPSLSIRHDRVLTAVQRPLSMCWQTVNPTQTIPPTALFFRFSSFAFPFILCRPIFFILFISLQPIKAILFSVPLLASPTKAPSFIPSFTFCPNLCPQYFTPSYPTCITLQCTIRPSPAILSTSSITKVLCNQLFLKIPCLVASEVVPYTMQYFQSCHTRVFCYICALLPPLIL